MLDSKGRMINCAECGHGRWVYVLSQDTYACQRHGWNARCAVVDMRFLKRDSATWQQAWEGLKTKYGEVDPGWQYMCTVMKEGKAEHQFRHREFPGNGGNRTYFNFQTEVIESDY